MKEAKGTGAVLMEGAQPCRRTRGLCRGLALSFLAASKPQARGRSKKQAMRLMREVHSYVRETDGSYVTKIFGYTT